MSISLCEDCVYYSYDEESDSYYCDEQLDEDEMASFLRGKDSHDGHHAKHGYAHLV